METLLSIVYTSGDRRSCQIGAAPNRVLAAIPIELDSVKSAQFEASPAGRQIGVEPDRILSTNPAKLALALSPGGMVLELRAMRFEGDC
jgi:hypothetical protein